MALLGMMGFLLLERLIMILGDLAHQHMNESNVSDASLFFTKLLFDVIWHVFYLSLMLFALDVR